MQAAAAVAVHPAFGELTRKLAERYGARAVVLDFETTGVDPGTLRVTCGAILKAGLPGVHVFAESGVQQAWSRWIEPCSVLIAHNAQFEVTVLRQYIHADAVAAWLARVRIVDAFAVVNALGAGYISLANLCHCNATRVPFPKTGKGGDAIALAREGRTLELEDYNVSDVVATAALAVCETLEFCVGMFDKQIGAQRHFWTGVVDMDTLAVTFENRFPTEAPTVDACFCAVKFRQDRARSLE
jgi:hypothetical protein